MASRASLSMLVTLEERERLKELSRWSNGLAPRGGHTDRRTVRGKKKQRGKAPASGRRGKTDEKWKRTANKIIHEKDFSFFFFLFLNLKDTFESESTNAENTCQIGKCQLRVDARSSATH